MQLAQNYQSDKMRPESGNPQENKESTNSSWEESLAKALNYLLAVPNNSGTDQKETQRNS